MICCQIKYCNWAVQQYSIVFSNVILKLHYGDNKVICCPKKAQLWEVDFSAQLDIFMIKKIHTLSIKPLFQYDLIFQCWQVIPIKSHFNSDTEHNMATFSMRCVHLYLFIFSSQKQSTWVSNYDINFHNQFSGFHNTKLKALKDNCLKWVF